MIDQTKVGKANYKIALLLAYSLCSKSYFDAATCSAAFITYHAFVNQVQSPPTKPAISTGTNMATKLKGKAKLQLYLTQTV